MKTQSLIQLIVLLGLLIGLGPLLGRYLARVLSGESHLLSKWFAPLESVIYRAGGIVSQEDMSWKQYFGVVRSCTIRNVIVLQPSGAIPCQKS